MPYSSNLKVYTIILTIMIVVYNDNKDNISAKASYNIIHICKLHNNSKYTMAPAIITLLLFVNC